MKKFNFLLLIMLLFTLTSAWAGNPVPAANNTDSYPEKARTNFSIKAYKKTPDPVIMTIFDAFSRNLDEVMLNSEINVYPKMAFFLTDDFAKLQDPHKRVIFSFLITGASTGTFDLSITITPFKGPCTYANNTWTDGPNTIESHFDFVDYDINFQRGGKTSSGAGSYGIEKMTAPANTNKTASEVNAELNAKWSVYYKGPATNADTSAIGEFWNAEGSVAMAILKSGKDSYEGSNNTGGSGEPAAITPAGRYQATVTINLKIT